MKKNFKKNIKNIILRFWRIILVAYVLFCFLIFFSQKTFIFFPFKEVLSFPSYSNLSEINIKTKDRVNLNAWFLDNKSDKTVIFFHGNWWNIYYNQERLKIFNDFKLNALLFDYRSYWKSDWEIKKEEDLYLDWEAAYKYLLDNWYKDNQIILWGQSLGWWVAINTAQNKNIRALIIESTFYSMENMAKKQFPYLPTSLLLKYKFKNFDKLKNIKSPILVIHSKNDEMIDYENWKNLFDLIKWEKYFLETTGSHNYGFSKSYDLYVSTIKNFLWLN